MLSLDPGRAIRIGRGQGTVWTPGGVGLCRCGETSIMRITLLEAGRRGAARRGARLLREEGRVAKDLDIAVGQTVYLGRSVSVTLTGVDAGQAKLRFVAPRCVAITRDDYTLEQHLEFQRQREAEGALG